MKKLQGKSGAISLLRVCAFAITITNSCFAEHSAGKVRAYHAKTWSSQAIYCQATYAVSNCKAETIVLLDRLREYPVPQLGSWTWVLVPSSEWQSLATSLGLDPDTPAFTSFSDRMTVLEQALISPDARHGASLIRTFGMPIPKLLELAISHELGHALCHFTDERKADAAGERLRARDPSYCEQSPNRNVKVAFGLHEDIWGAN
jgi:hypothetical protein